MARMDEDALFSTMRDKLFTAVVGECSTRRPRSERRMVQWVDQEKAISLIREQKPKSSDANFVKRGGGQAYSSTDWSRSTPTFDGAATCRVIEHAMNPP